MGKYKVIGPAIVGGVSAPDTVDLDEYEIAPGKTNIDALVESGCIEAPKAKTESEDAKPAKPEPKPKDG